MFWLWFCSGDRQLQCHIPWKKVETAPRHSKPLCITLLWKSQCPDFLSVWRWHVNQHLQHMTYVMECALAIVLWFMRMIWIFNQGAGTDRERGKARHRKNCVWRAEIFRLYNACIFHILECIRTSAESEPTLRSCRQRPPRNHDSEPRWLDDKTGGPNLISNPSRSTVYIKQRLSVFEDLGWW